MHIAIRLFVGKTNAKSFKSLSFLGRSGNNNKVSLMEKNDLAKIVEQHEVFFLVFCLFVAIVLAYLIYTYDRSFRVHQDTVKKMHEYNMSKGVIYTRIHVGHDGTTLEAAPFPKEVGPAGTSTHGAKEVGLAGTSTHGESPSDPSSPSSPLEQFSIHPLIMMKIGNFFFSFTNSSLFMLLTLVLVLLLLSFVTKKGGGKLVPNAWQSLVELIYDFVLNLVNEQIGGLSGNVKQKFFPCILVTFLFLLFCNLQGMIPFSFTVTSHFLITLALSFSIFIGITIVGFQRHGLHFFSILLPAGVPMALAPFLVLLELISYCFRALSLGIRLFANMMAGHSLVKILSGFAWTMLFMNNIFYFIGDLGPLFIVLALTGLELGVAILQAYVFTILICIYLNDAINLH